MNQTSCFATSTHALHCALELSKKSWLLAIQFPDREQPSVYSIKGGDTEKLMAKLTAARDCWAKVSGSLPVITVCYEVGYDAFWLARFLKARGIECLVIDPGSLQVNRRGRRVKTDRVDVKMLLRTLIAWCRGERHVWSPVRIPSVDEEDLRRSHRERSRLVRERTAHINRIKGLLFAQGIRDVKVKSQYKTLAVDKLLTADGEDLRPRPLSERKAKLATLLARAPADSRSTSTPTRMAAEPDRPPPQAVGLSLGNTGTGRVSRAGGPPEPQNPALVYRPRAHIERDLSAGLVRRPGAVYHVLRQQAANLRQGAHVDLDTRRDGPACGTIALRCRVNVATVQRSEHDRTHLRERSHLLGRLDNPRRRQFDAAARPKRRRR